MSNLFIPNVQLLIISSDHKRVLCTRRSEKEAISGGVIDFPGGKLEKTDTSLESCAVRECLEETGITLQDTSLNYVCSTIFHPDEDTSVLNTILYTIQDVEINEDFNLDMEEVVDIFLAEITDDFISSLPEWNQDYLNRALEMIHSST